MFSSEFYHSPGDSFVRHRQLGDSIPRSWRVPSPASAPFVVDLTHSDGGSVPLKSETTPSDTALASTLPGWLPGLPSPASVYSSPRSEISSISSGEGRSHLSPLPPNQYLGRAPFPSEFISRDLEPADSPSRLAQRSPSQAFSQISQYVLKETTFSSECYLLKTFPSRASDSSLLSQSMHPGSVAFLTTNMAHNSQSMFASMASKLFELLALTRSRLRLAKQATPASSSDFNAYGSTIISPGTHTSTPIWLPSSISTSACHLTELLSARTSVYTLPHLTAGCAPEPTPASKVPISVLPELTGMKIDRFHSSSIPYPYPSASVSGSPPTMPDPSFTST